MSKSKDWYGEARLFSFPFWLMIDGNDTLKLYEISIGKHKFRFYPPFRSGDANFLPMPHIRPSNIPFIPGTEIEISEDYKGLRPAAIPVLGTNAKGEVSLIFTFTEDLNEIPTEQIPMDSMRIDFMAISDESEEVRPNDFIQNFLAILRDISKQWWILRSIDGLMGYSRQFFTIEINGSPKSHLNGAISPHTPFGTEKLINNEIWFESIKKFEQGYLPSQSDLMMLDVLYYAAINDLRSALLHCSMALELEVEDTFERLWTKKTTEKFKKGRLMSGNSLPEHLSEDLERFYNRSYQKEKQDNFLQIENMWLGRGNVAHGGQAEFHRDGKLTTIDKTLIIKYSRIVEDCIDWLRTIV